MSNRESDACPLSRVRNGCCGLLAAVIVLVAMFPFASHAALITTSGDPALGGALVETFDSYADGDFATQDFLIGVDGFTVTPVAGDMQIGSTWCDDFGTTGSCIGTNSAGGANDDFDVVFTGAGVSAFGFELNALDVDWTIETYDAGDNLLGTYVVTSQSPGLTGFNRRGYFGATEVAPIQYFTVRSTGDDWALIDDFAYTPVPEPGTAVLAGLGLLGLALIGRKPTDRPSPNR